MNYDSRVLLKDDYELFVLKGMNEFLLSCFYKLRDLCKECDLFSDEGDLKFFFIVLEGECH